MTASEGHQAKTEYSVAEIQRQFTRYLRDPENSPLPPGTDAVYMEMYARHYRDKLYRVLENWMSGLVDSLGKKRVIALLNEYVRLPRESLYGVSSFEDAFCRWLKSESQALELPRWIPDLADYSLAIKEVNALEEISEDGIDSEEDLLAGIPVFSELAKLLCFEWPVHRIGEDFIPETKPLEPVWLIVYRNRQGRCSYLELNRLAADIAARVRDNVDGCSGEEILIESESGFSLAEPAARVQEGIGILEALRKRDIILGVRAFG